MNDRSEVFKLIKSIFYGLTIITVCVIVILKTSFQDTKNEYLLITQEKIITTGQITEAEEFEQEIESNDSRTVDIVNGYSYKYSFLTSEGIKVETNSSIYGELPLDKVKDDIPYEVEIEYLFKNPEINRIKDLWTNDNNLFQWFQHKIAMNLLGFIFCLFFSGVFIKGGIKDYKIYKKTLSK